MHRSEGRILTTHTGSLPRPKALTELFARRGRGQKKTSLLSRRSAGEELFLRPRKVQSRRIVLKLWAFTVYLQFFQGRFSFPG